MTTYQVMFRVVSRFMVEVEADDEKAAEAAAWKAIEDGDPDDQDIVDEEIIHVWKLEES